MLRVLQPRHAERDGYFFRAADGTLSLPSREWVERFGWFFLRTCKSDPDDYQFRLGDRTLRALLDSPLFQSDCFAELRSLEVTCDRLDARTAKVIAGSTSFPVLTALRLTHKMIDDQKARLLAEAAGYANLVELDVSNSSGLTAEGTVALVSPRQAAIVRSPRRKTRRRNR